MASVGHSLLGLSFADFSDKESRGNRLPYVWLGFMILMGHLVDVVEWLVIIVAPSFFDRHFVTYSPIVTAGIAAIVCLLLFLVFRVRRLLVYVLIVLAIFSHLLLDLDAVRTGLSDAYFGGLSPDGEAVSVVASVPAEIWAYGGLLLLVLLFNASRQQGVPRGGRVLSVVFAMLSIGAAITRNPFLWGPAYVLAGLHALLLYRRCWTWRVVWGLIPVAPLCVLLACEMWSFHLYRVATDLRHEGRFVAAEETYQRMIAVPTRSPKELARVYLATCLISQKRLGEAESLLHDLIATAEQPDFPQITLAAMYMSKNAKGTQYYKPTKAAALCHELIAGRSRERLKENARGRLRRLQAAGEIDAEIRPIPPIAQ